MSAPAQSSGEPSELRKRISAILVDRFMTLDQKVAAVYAAADEVGVPRPGRPTLVEWIPQATDHTVKMAMRKAAAHVSVVRDPKPDDTVSMAPVVDVPIVDQRQPVAVEPVTAPVAVEPVAMPTAPTSARDEQVNATSTKPAADPDKKRSASKGFYFVALMSIGVSVDTSWRFFEQKLGITNVVERAFLFSVMEAALIACGWSMREGVRSKDRKPGPARLVAWGLTVFAAYAAFSLSGLELGIARVSLGPLLGLVMLHLALGIDLRESHQTTTTWSRIGRELRERLLSRLGLGNDERDALARTRDRAALRAARLSAVRWAPFRGWRLRKALHASNVAHDDVQRARMLAELNVLQHAAGLAKTKQASPWPETQP